MNKFEWKSIVKFNILALKLIGLWPSEDDTYQRNFYSFYSATVLIVFVCGHNVFQTINVFLVLDDLEAFTATIFVTLTCIGGVLKAYSLIQNMDTLKKLFVTLRSEMFQPKISQMDLIQPSIRVWTLIYNSLCVMAALCAFFWTTYPILDKSEYRLPFLAWYPFETSVSPNYELTYLYQIISVYYIEMVNFNIDALIAALNMFIGAQCDILCDNLRNLAELGLEENFVICIKHHKAILEYVVINFCSFFS